MKNKFRFLIVLVLFFTTQLKAQQVGVYYKAGLNYNPSGEKYIGVVGSPYFFPDWLAGNAYTADKAEKGDLFLKYDEVDDIVIIKGENNQVFSFSNPVLEFTLIDSKTKEVKKFRSGFAPGKFTTERSFFEIIADGQVKLVKKNHKSISESKTLTGAVSKSIVETVRYYLIGSANAPIQVKLDLKSISEVLTDKQAELAAFTKENKLNLKKESDAASLVTYYNKLKVPND